MNVSSWLNQAKTKVDSIDAELILSHVLGQDRVFLVSHNNYELADNELGLANKMLLERQNGRPLAYLTGSKEFYGRNFEVNPSVLIPRPETEDLIDIVKTLPGKRILDVGTGSGCIAITLALECPESEVTAVDISVDALSSAQQNADKLGAKVTFLESDLLKNVSGDFDIIVANLPYVDESWGWLDKHSLSFEPSLALYADDSGLALIKKLIDQIIARDFHGYLVLESDTCQQDAIKKYALERGLEHIRTQGFITLFTVGA